MIELFRQPVQLFMELRRRHVFRVAAVYGAAVFGLLQVLSVVFPALYIPGWVMTVVVVMVLAGFPVAISLGWVFDLTPAGVRRTAPPQEGAAVAATPGDEALATGQSVVVARMQRLDVLLAREGVLPLARAVDIVGQLAAALEAEHQRGRSHGRIRPEAVIVAPDRRGADVVRLLDVEPSAATGQHPVASQLAAGRGARGDPMDRRSDVHALALLLFRMLTGGAPYAGAGEGSSAAGAMVPPLRLSDVFPSRRYPEGVQRLLDRALAPRPEDRPADAGEFRRELARAIEGERGYTRVFARLRWDAEAARAADVVDAMGAATPASSTRKRSLGKMAVVGAVTIGIAALATRVATLLLLNPAAGIASPPPSQSSFSVPVSEKDPGATAPAARPRSVAMEALVRLPQQERPGRDPRRELAIDPPAIRLGSDDATLVLARLSERSGSRTPGLQPAIRDTAAAIWGDVRFPAHTRAFAAFLAGNAEAAEHQPARCVSWLERAVKLDPEPAYRDMLASCRRKT